MGRLHPDVISYHFCLHGVPLSHASVESNVDERCAVGAGPAPGRGGEGGGGRAWAGRIPGPLVPHDRDGERAGRDWAAGARCTPRRLGDRECGGEEARKVEEEAGGGEGRGGEERGAVGGGHRGEDLRRARHGFGELATAWIGEARRIGAVGDEEGETGSGGGGRWVLTAQGERGREGGCGRARAGGRRRCRAGGRWATTRDR
uniref:Uncharacterized protein n=1 Tax=Oryza rufipogon TaxID=4529 RepID=A0A0E0QQU0_ORYRU